MATACLLLTMSVNAQDRSPYIHKVFDFCPAPGQFVNLLPEYEAGDTKADMIRKVEEAIAGEARSLITLGAYGGYVTFGFDHMVVNAPGEADFKIWGNAFVSASDPDAENPRDGGSCEPGIVMVSYDANGNGLPDDVWYELAGSEYRKPETVKNYQIVYHKPDESKEPTPDESNPYLTDTTYIRWHDNQSGEGYVLKNSFHDQSYFPLWLDEDIDFEGTLLADNYVDESGEGTYYVQYAYAWGYADNYPNNDERSSFNIEWAVDNAGNPVSLPGIHFVKVYTAVNQSCGWLGESSTELSGAEDLHPEMTAVKDYTQGVFIVNEDWFGHNSGSVNYLSNTGIWSYRVFETENPGKTLGTTSVYGTIYGDRFYILSKQPNPESAEATGSRLAVCDAKTMECLAEFSDLYGGDGRSFVGVTPSKGYIGTGSGIVVIDLDELELVKQIEGIPSAQIGNMIRVGSRLFAVQQATGLHVINTEEDLVESTIEGSYGSVVLSQDGNLWLSTNSATIRRVDPYTLEVTDFDLPAEATIPNSWFAWTPDGFCASKQQNRLYWKNDGGWGASKKIYCYDIESNTTRELIDFSDTGWGLYGAGFRIHPLTDELYCSLFKSFGEASYVTMRVSNAGEILDIYEMESHYWFPSIPVFPDNHAPVISEDFSTITLTGETKIYLGDKFTDDDNITAGSLKSIKNLSNPQAMTATVRNDSLLLVPQAGYVGHLTFDLSIESNGKVATKEIAVVIESTSAISPVDDSVKVNVYPNPVSDYLNIEAAVGEPVALFSSTGKCLYRGMITQPTTTMTVNHLATGYYFLRVGQRTVKIIKE